MKRYFLLCSGLFIFLFTANCSNSAENKTAGGKAVGDDPEVVAKINGTPIGKHILDRSIEAMRQNRRPDQLASLPQDKKGLEKEALRRLISIELLYQQCQAKNLVAKDEEVDKTLARLKSRFPNEETFKQKLAQSQSSEKELKKDIRRDLSIKSLIDQEIVPKLVVTEKESNDFYQNNQDKMQQPESIRASHILVKLDKNTPAEKQAAARKKIEELKERADKGEDFAELARKNSEGPSAKTGGDLGFFTRGKMVPEFEKSAFGLKEKGQISGVVKTPFGFHVIKLIEKRPEGIVPFEKAKQGITQFLKNQKMQGELNKYVQGLFKNAKIETQIDIGESPIMAP